jgi:hypothetical protein
MPAAATLACSPDDLSAVAKLVGAAAAADVCAAVDVAAAGSPLAAVLRHLTAASAAAKPAAAAAAAEQAHSTDVVFILFSGYLVFLMQVGRLSAVCGTHLLVPAACATPPLGLPRCHPCYPSIPVHHPPRALLRPRSLQRCP